MPLIVSNTSPIINLAAIGQLYLLQQLYGDIIIPEAVYHEIVVQGAGQPGSIEVRQERWFKRGSVTEPATVANLLAANPLLNLAEAEAIMLAVAIQADRLLIDEMVGRRVATAQGVPIRGVLGILAEAKRKELIPLVRPHMDRLIHDAGFFLTDPLYVQILHDVGE